MNPFYMCLNQSLKVISDYPLNKVAPSPANTKTVGCTLKSKLIGFCTIIHGVIIATALAAENSDGFACSGQAQYNWASYRGKAGNSVSHPANAVSVDCSKNGLTYSATAMLRNPENNRVSGDTMVVRQIAVSNNAEQAMTWTAGMLHNATGIAGANHTFWYNAYPQGEPTILVDWRSTDSLMIQQLIGATVRHRFNVQKGVLELSGTLGWSVDSQFRLFGKRLNGYGLSAGRGMGTVPSFISDATYVKSDATGGNWAVGIQGGRLAEGYNGLVAAESRLGLHIERTLMHTGDASTYIGSELYRLTNQGGRLMSNNYYVGTVGIIHYRPINALFSTYIASSFNGNSIDGLFASVETGVRWAVIKKLYLTAATGYEKPLGSGLVQSDQFGFYGGMQYQFDSK